MEVGSCVERIGPSLERCCRYHCRCFGRGFNLRFYGVVRERKEPLSARRFLCGTNALSSTEVRTIDWLSGQLACETLADHTADAVD